jgi:hypothetical protein
MKGLQLSVVVFLLLTCSAQPICASMTWENALKLKKTEPASLYLYLSGLLDAFQISNVKLRLQNQPRLFCPPENLVLNADNLMQMLEDHLKRYPRKGEAIGRYVDIDAIFALQETFPCN